MLDYKIIKEINKILLLSNTIQRRIIDLSENIEESVLAKLQNNIFALQLMNQLIPVTMHN